MNDEEYRELIAAPLTVDDGRRLMNRWWLAVWLQGDPAAVEEIDGGYGPGSIIGTYFGSRSLFDAVADALVVWLISLGIDPHRFWEMFLTVTYHLDGEEEYPATRIKRTAEATCLILMRQIDFATAQLTAERLPLGAFRHVPDSGLTETARTAQIASDNDARNAWLYEQRRTGRPLKSIVSELAKRNEGWEVITSVPGVSRAIDAYAERHELPKLKSNKRRGSHEN